MRLAAIGIGSNSVRLLVADAAANGAITPVLRDRCGTRLFAGLVDGALTEESMEVSASASRELERKAREAGAGKIYIFATSAVRDAKNGDAFIERIRSMTGLTLDVCTGEQEALLSYAGAAKPGLCGMIDIGGGSTELTPWGRTARRWLRSVCRWVRCGWHASEGSHIGTTFTLSSSSRRTSSCGARAVYWPVPDRRPGLASAGRLRRWALWIGRSHRSTARWSKGTR